MAITRLTDFITVATNKWTYGDSAFKYEGEVNQDHDTIYPLMLIEPPTSRMPDIYEGWEHYNVEIEFYNNYQTAVKNVVTLQKRWDNLQDLALEWLDNVLIEYSGGVIPNVSTSSPTPTQVYIDKESLQIERAKNNKNDKLCRITMRFDMRMFTRCFTPKSVYPNTIDDLVIWLSADSNVGFSIPTKQVETWGDKSGNNNNVSQNTKTLQPKRYSYAEETLNSPTNEGQFNGKTRIAFPNGSTNYLTSDTPGNGPLASGDFTVFIVAAYNTDVTATQESVFNSEQINASAGQIELGQRVVSSYQGIVTDGTNTITANVSNADNEIIMCYKLSGDTLTLYANGVAGTPATTAGFDATGKFIVNEWHIGALPTIATSAFEGGVAEILVYDSVLTDSEREQVDYYLNNKYKIY